MSSKYFAGNKGHYIFCDICGEATYDFDVVRLTSQTGKPGLLVCPKDADKTDYGLMPYAIPREKSVSFARTNHTNIDNSAAPIDYDTTTELGT